MTAKTQEDEMALATDIPIGISACVLGQEVRYNGGHKLDRFIRDTLGAYVRFVPVCPEVEIGLGIPRETLRLVRGDDGEAGSVRLVAPKSDTDRTELMASYARKRTRQLAKEDLCGYILQKGSPSCGMERVRIYSKAGVAPARNGTGLFARQLVVCVGPGKMSAKDGGCGRCAKAMRTLRPHPTR